MEKQDDLTIDINKVKLLKTLGDGSFSKVYLISYEDKHYALKLMEKCNIFREKKIPSIKLEKEILTKLKHPFINEMSYFHQDLYNLYYILPFISGGELFTHIRKSKVFSPDVTLFYSSEILSAIMFLHKNNIIYRDLKPENVLIEGNGHIKLIDFGNSKKIEENAKAFTLCGTAEYLAPEVIKRVMGYSYAADYWAFGILVYEMMVGRPPFWAKDVFEMYEKIQNDQPFFPEKFDAKAKDLILKLLDKNDKTRLGSKGKSIMKHPFFKFVDWKLIEDKKIPTPWRPKSEDPKAENINFQDLFQGKNKLPEEYQNQFENF